MDNKLQIIHYPLSIIHYPLSIIKKETSETKRSEGIPAKPNS